MKINLMVTAAGSAISNGIVKSLKLSNLDCNIITTDIHPYASGLYRGNAGYIVPLGESSDFVDEIIKICNKENINGILIGTDYELLKFSENKERIEKETNAKVIVSSPEVINISNDKWLTYKFLKENNLPCIPSSLDANELTEFPLIVKPRIGDSSKDTFVVKNKEELNEKLSLVENPVIQKYIEGEEYTSTTLTFDGKCYGILSMKREMRFGGHTTKAEIRDFPEINREIKKIVEKLKPTGPCNFQSRIVDGVPKVFEINCRFSGTSPFCSQVGFNTVENTVKHYILKEQISELTDYKKGVFLRYFNEVFVPHEEIDKIKNNKQISDPKSEINKSF